MKLGRAFGWIVAIVLATSCLMAQNHSLAVKVEYKGGEVNQDHPVWVFLWSSSDFGNSIPIGFRTLTGNATIAEFPNIGVSPVYITVAYDEKGGYNPQVVGAPPSGTPVAAYVEAVPGSPSPIALKEEGVTEIKLTFDGSFRMP